MPLKEKPSASQIRETLNSLFNFTLIAGYEETQHIAIKTFKTAEIKLTRTAEQSLITSIFV